MGKYSSYVLFLLTSLLVVILFVNGFGPLEKAQRSFNDFLSRVTASEDTPPHVVLISVDGRAQAEYGRWPWNRDRIADLLAAVASAGPKVIAVDMELAEDAFQDSAGYTDVLAGQLTWIENVVIPYDIALATFRSNRTSCPDYLFNNSVAVENPLGLMDEESSLLVRKVFLPADKLLQSKPYLGFDYTMPDEDRVLRHQPLIMHYEGYYYPALPLLAAAVYLDVAPDQIKAIENEEILLGGRRRIPISDASEHRITFAKADAVVTYSAAAVLGEEFDFSRLENKLILVGVDDPAAREVFSTPVQPEVSELIVKATVMENIINNNFLYPGRNQGLPILLVLLLTGGLCAFILPQVSVTHRMVILGIGLVIVGNVTYFLFSSFHIVPRTIYIALELLLFMGCAPFLDFQLLGPAVSTRKEQSEKKKQAQAKARVSARMAPVAVATREIKASAQDPENQPTSMILPDHRFPEDHQAINVDGEDAATATTPRPVGPAAVEPAAKKSPEPFEKAPEIIAPDNTAQSSAGLFADSDDHRQEPLEDAPPAPEIKSLGRYQVTGVLGKGAMGKVYKGIDPAINRPLALKTIRLDFVGDPREEAELRERLHREAQAAGKLSHSNIVTVYDVGSEGHLQYIAMEYLEGQTLEEMIKKKVKFNYRIIAQIIVQICSALDYAHEQGIIHRDIKPANLMVLKDYRVKVMDYGIARIDSSSMTKTGIAMGTPNYISPEQLRGQKTDHRADIFSLGVVVYEMLLGRRPFRGENLTSLIYSILNHEPEKPSNLNPQIPLLFDRIVDLALRKDPNDRYQHAGDLAMDLKDFVDSFVVKG